MKKSILLAIFALLPLVHAIADEVVIDGIKYNLIKKAKEAEVIAYTYVDEWGTTHSYYSGDIVIPATVEYEGVTYRVTSIGNEAFRDCTSLTSVTIPESVTSIGQYAFYDFYSNDLRIYLSDLVVWCRSNNISSGYKQFFLFLNGVEIKDLVIPESVTSISEGAFRNCTSLTSVTIPESVTSIPYNCFSGCTSLTSVTIPESVTSIHGGAFSNCSSLTSVTIPESVTSIGSTETNTGETSVFAGCSSLTSVTIPGSVTCIGIAAFRDCSSLTSVTIPESVTTIGNSAFERCSSLTSITIPESVTNIGNNAFYACSGLASVIISDRVTRIGGGAFSGCKGLTSVVIGKSVLYIDGYDNYGGQLNFGHSFSECKELTDVYCYAPKVPQANVNTFDDSFLEYATLHVPEDLVEQYKQTAPWSGFGSIVAIGGEGGEQKEQCASPVISYADGKLSVTCKTEGATCFFATGAAVFTSMDFRAHTGDADLSKNLQLMIYAYATADGYEKSDVVSKQISVPFGTYVNVEVHDTTYVDVPYEVEVHDTTYVNVEVHDTTYVDVPYEVEVHDTTYVNVEIHDTTYVDVPYEVVVIDTISVPTAQEIPAPTIVVDNGRVEILSGLEDAVIYYTLDGTTPVVSDENRYDGPFTVSGDCTISAIAVLTSDAAAKEVIDGIWNRPSQAATYRYYRTNGIETDTPTNGVTIVVTTGTDGKQKVTKRIIK